MAVDLEADGNLGHIRDYVGMVDPTDDQLAELAEPFTYWQEVALRVLRRRLAEAGSAGEPSFSLAGVLAVGATPSAHIPTLGDAISRLERQLAELTGVAGPSGVHVGRMVRPDRRR